MRKFIRTYKRQLIGFIVAIVLVVGVVGALWATNVFGWRQWRIQEVQNFIGATLPVDAVEIQFTTRSQSTRIIWLRFNLPADTDLTAFLTQMGITDPLKTGFTPFPALNPQEVAIAWWQPFGSTNSSGVYWNTGSKTIEMLVDNTHAAKQVVYLRAYSFSQK
ncbi:MAG: hypothetical protein GC179_09100 [Anaerolineaceae bacterium]|nr:hypothetical protein [Anaerolineaceae bacterium]